MSSRNNSIRNYFQPSSQLRKTPAAGDVERKDSLSLNSIAGETAEGDKNETRHLGSNETRDKLNLELSSSLKSDTDPRSSAQQSSRDRVIIGSDEESDSDSSLEDIYEALQIQSRPKYTSSAVNGFDSRDNSRTRSKRKRMLIQPSPAKPKYKFDMKSLIQQAEEHKATEESTLSMKALLQEFARDEPQGDDSNVALDNILQSVLAEKGQDGEAPGKLLRAAKRTEAIRNVKECYLFDFERANSNTTRPPPASTKNGWRAMLADPQPREQVLLSGFARDMVLLEDTLEDNLFDWMLDEICFECRNDMREAYCDVLTTVGQQIRQSMSLDVVMDVFQKIGVKEAALDISKEVELISSDQRAYAGHDWTPQRAVISFIGRVSRFLTMESSSYILCLLIRLCIDSMVMENTGLLAAIQKTIEQLCSDIEEKSWETICHKICATTFRATSSAALRLQVLRCIPQTSRRVHEVRRRLALASFFDDIKYTASAPQDSLDLSMVTEALMQPRFTISKETDYLELGAIISILNIAIDNGLSFTHDITSSEGEIEFNREVDILATRIKRIWGTINDAGAAFLSRSYAKEMMEGLRMRLELTIRTKPKPKLSIFETDEPGDEQILLRQTTLSRKLFQKKSVDEGVI